MKYTKPQEVDYGDWSPDNEATGHAVGRQAAIMGVN